MPKATFFNLPEEKRERILKAALEEFSLSDYDKATIDNITKRASIPKGSFYQYFTHKDDLYEYAFNRIGDSKAQMIEELISEVDTIEFKDYVYRMILQGARYEARMKEYSGLRGKFLNQCPQDLRKRILKNEIPKSYRLLEEAMKAYIEKGEILKDADIKTAAYMITSCVINLEFFAEYEPKNTQEIIAKMIHIVTKGIGRIQ